MTSSCIVVTGAAAGIGRAITELLVSEGYEIVAVDSNSAGLARLAQLGTAVTTVEDDLTTGEHLREQIDRTFRHRTINGLVNCAARGALGAFHEVSSEQWQSSFAAVLGPVEVATRAVLPTMLEQRAGAIVNIASVNGLIASPGLAAYTAAKGAVHALTRQLAVEYGPRGIRVNSVSPGLIDTDSTPTPPDLVEQRLRVEPYLLGRLGRPQEVASAVSFLLSDRASFITGVDLPVDGGLIITSPAAVVTNAQRLRWNRPPLNYGSTD